MYIIAFPFLDFIPISLAVKPAETCAVEKLPHFFYYLIMTKDCQDNYLIKLL